VTGQPVCGQEATWTFGPFDKPKDANPVITPSPASRFRSAMSDTIARWEEHATFNPAAVVKDGRVFVLYRAEDASGERMIGGHTSRIGLAESLDGLQFARRSVPVLYPDTDAQRPYEWPGGVEDPRIVEAQDGSYVLTYTQWNGRIPRLAVATSRDLVHSSSPRRTTSGRDSTRRARRSWKGWCRSAAAGTCITARRTRGSA